MDCTLTVLDTAAIQSYIFGSNELRENIGASHLVHVATTHWVEETLDEVIGAGRHNYRVKQDEINPYDEQFHIEPERPSLRAEVMYAGGGNTFLLFAGEGYDEKARDFVYKLGKRIIETAPGLNLYAAHMPYKWEDNLPETIRATMQQLSRTKNTHPVYQPTLGLSVTAACTSTGLPANGEHPDPDRSGKREGRRATLANRANRQVIAQWQAAGEEATTRLRALFPFVKDTFGFWWTDDLDKIGKLPERDESFIAVVHADGNGMGKKMLLLTNVFERYFGGQTRPYINTIREMSMSFRRTAQDALVATVRDLAQTLEARRAEGLLLYPIGQDEDDKGRPYFPLRPVVFGGDDVTFVSAGAWGLSLAHRYLTHLEKGNPIPGFESLFNKHLPAKLEAQIQTALEDARRQQVMVDDTPPYACAGVSIVKTHYPISRAYHNSEALAKSAKQMVLAYVPQKTASAIDWHFTTTGLSGELGDIRQREYEAAQPLPDDVSKAVDRDGVYYRLTMRPLMLANDKTWRNWENFQNVFTRFEHGWADARSKLMALRETLREGPDAVDEFARLERKGAILPTLSPFSHTVNGHTLAMNLKNGWMMWDDLATAVSHLTQLREADAYRDLNRELDEVGCAYFDAIEMQDQFLLLD